MRVRYTEREYVVNVTGAVNARVPLRCTERTCMRRDMNNIAQDGGECTRGVCAGAREAR